MPKSTEPKPTPPKMENFIKKYVKFAEELTKAEAESNIPKEQRSNSERIHEVFRFWYLDCRDREDLARDLRILDEERARAKREKKDYWELEDDDEDF